MIRKVKFLEGDERKTAESQGLRPDDLVIVSDDGQIEKIEGDPVSYLLKRSGTK